MASNPEWGAHGPDMVRRKYGEVWKEERPFHSSRSWYVQFMGYREGFRTKRFAIEQAALARMTAQRAADRHREWVTKNLAIALEIHGYASEYAMRSAELHAVAAVAIERNMA